MDRILLTRELGRQGYHGTEIETMVRQGDLVRLRRGAYLTGPAPSAPGDPREQHRRLIHATLGQCRDGNVVSHMSAAVLHGLPIWRDQLQRVQVIRDRAGGGRSRRHVVVRGMPLADGEVELVDGLVTTTLARTVVDLACQLPMRRSVPVGDAALRMVAETTPTRDLRAELTEALGGAGRRPGVPTARRAVAFLEARSESPGESYSRVVMHERGLPRPELQYEIVDDNGLLIARCDFAWPELRTVGEFDGWVKYTGQFGKNTTEVVVAEKRREDSLRSYGWQVARWIWTDLDRPSEFAATLNRAFALAR